ncbi:MAG: hypothetical protein K0B16_16840 [Burkholderiaceae bacterium]|nr:hypothetical protein [Burkholderiaceae bacterium]
MVQFPDLDAKRQVALLRIGQQAAQVFGQPAHQPGPGHQVATRKVGKVYRGKAFEHQAAQERLCGGDHVELRVKPTSHAVKCNESLEQHRQVRRQHQMARAHQRDQVEHQFRKV